MDHFSCVLGLQCRFISHNFKDLCLACEPGPRRETRVLAPPVKDSICRRFPRTRTLALLPPASTHRLGRAGHAGYLVEPCYSAPAPARRSARSGIGSQKHKHIHTFFERVCAYIRLRDCSTLNTYRREDTHTHTHTRTHSHT